MYKAEICRAQDPANPLDSTHFGTFYSDVEGIGDVLKTPDWRVPKGSYSAGVYRLPDGRLFTVVPGEEPDYEDFDQVGNIVIDATESICDWGLLSGSQVFRALHETIATYSAYLMGEVWHVSIVDETGHRVCLDFPCNSYEEAEYWANKLIDLYERERHNDCTL